jgi:1-acyl-sn-glycerol-3-phosphate acyltransferase
MNVLRSMLFVLVFYPVGTLLTALAVLESLFGQDAVIRGSRRWALWHRWCARMILGISWDGVNHIKAESALYVFKHESMFEAIETLALFDRPIVVMKEELLRLPIWGTAARKHGSIGVDREAGATAMRAMMVAAKRAKASGRPIILFPEGTRTPHGQSPPLKAGLAGLYKMLGLPVIPVAVDAGRIWPHGIVKTPGKVHLKIGETIPPGLPRQEVEARVHSAINALNCPSETTRLSPTQIDEIC